MPKNASHFRHAQKSSTFLAHQKRFSVSKCPKNPSMRNARIFMIFPFFYPMALRNQRFKEMFHFLNKKSKIQRNVPFLEQEIKDFYVSMFLCFYVSLLLCFWNSRNLLGFSRLFLKTIFVKSCSGGFV
jgi:hypothetical protein